jgi:hypothetical protein
MTIRTLTIPLRLNTGGERRRRLYRRKKDDAWSFALGRGVIDTWLYDVVDRRARETFETLCLWENRGEGYRCL